MSSAQLGTADWSRAWLLRSRRLDSNREYFIMRESEGGSVRASKGRSGSKVLLDSLEATTNGVPNNALSASPGAAKLQAD